MSKIVLQHFPAANLPEELRQGIDPTVNVTVTIEEERPRRRTMTLEEIFAARRPPYRSLTEITETLRRQRDEWDE